MENEKPKQLEFNGKKVRFYYQDLVAYTDDFLREIIWYQKELIERLGTKINAVEVAKSETHSQETKTLKMPEDQSSTARMKTSEFNNAELGTRLLTDKTPDNHSTREQIKEELYKDYS